MTKGLKNQSEKISEIGKVLRELGKSRTEVNYYMSIDEDFISDVLSCYRGWQALKLWYNQGNKQAQLEFAAIDKADYRKSLVAWQTRIQSHWMSKNNMGV